VIYLEDINVILSIPRVFSMALVSGAQNELYASLVQQMATDVEIDFDVV